MKQPKVISASPLPPPPSPIIGPRYLYSSIPPETVTLRVGDLIPLVPQDSWILGSDAGQRVEFPATEIFNGPVPRVAMSRLVELAPQCFRLPPESGQVVEIRLPVARLAAAYQLVSKRELIEDPSQSYVPTVIDDIPTEDLPSSFAAMAEEEYAPDPVVEVPPPVSSLPSEEKSAEETVEFTPPVAVPLEKPTPVASRRIFSVLPMFRRKGGEEPAPEPPVASESLPPAPTVRRPRVELPPLKTPGGNLMGEEGPNVLPQQLRAAPKPPIGAITSASWSVPPPVPPPVEEPETAFGLEAEWKPELEEPEPVSLQEPPPIPDPVVSEPELSAPPLESQSFLPPPPSPVLVPPTPAESALFVETEHFHATESIQPVLANHDELQAIFLTEEPLTTERIVELSGSLPGINSCVLSRGGGVIAAHNVPDSIDLISLSAHALDMIRAMRESSAKMGVGAVPAVTIHSEKGPITFFHEDDLCFLVLHKDRGFVPGVREKLQQVVNHLAQSRLPRPVAQPSRIVEG